MLSVALPSLAGTHQRIRILKMVGVALPRGLDVGDNEKNFTGRFS
jgi:hypothetical protein